MTIGAFTIILDQETNKFLLCHRRDKDLWNLPGGRAEDGEAPWEAALREIKEEVGLTTITLKTLVGVHFKPESNDLVFTFVAQKTVETPAISDEADRIEYFSIHEIPANTSPKQRDRIIEFFKNRAEHKTETVFYNQTGK
jgi:mutator protein MutT